VKYQVSNSELNIGDVVLPANQVEQPIFGGVVK
jgi:hypothetical protein